jgi:membrane protein YdbS with pleckstrin-like domain
MFEALRTRLLHFLRVPREPEPPFGAPGSVRVFRAGANYNRILLIRWGLTQITAFFGLLVGMFFVAQLFDQVETVRRNPAPKAAAPVAPATPPQVDPAPAAASAPADKNAKRAKRARRDDVFVRNAVARTPGWVFTLILLFESIGILIFIGQFLATLVAVRLEYEQHWYIVTDRSLRIRTGLFRVQESTMSFANLQQVQVSQGPLQRLLGLADVRVQSAGGGGAEEHKPGADASLHTGVFHSVANAPEIRDLILDRLRQFRATGLGDPDEAALAAGGVAPPRLAAAPATAADALLAARELLAEATALRRTLAG